DFIAQAFACDLTRFATLQLNFAGSFQPMPYAGANLDKNCHDYVAHLYDQNKPGSDANKELAQIQRYYAQKVAYVLDALDSIKEGDGTVLDHTIILWGNEMGDPALHGN